LHSSSRAAAARGESGGASSGSAQSHARLGAARAGLAASVAAEVNTSGAPLVRRLGRQSQRAVERRARLARLLLDAPLSAGSSASTVSMPVSTAELRAR
jgi:hypothetical protein